MVVPASGLQISWILFWSHNTYPLASRSVFLSRSAYCSNLLSLQPLLCASAIPEIQAIDARICRVRPSLRRDIGFIIGKKAFFPCGLMVTQWLGCNRSAPSIRGIVFERTKVERRVQDDHFSAPSCWNFSSASYRDLYLSLSRLTMDNTTHTFHWS